MLSYLFFFLNSFDSAMGTFLSDLGRTCLYGALGGVLAVVLYSVVSNQSKIKELKSETKRMRKQMRDPTLNYGEMIRLSKTNLLVSLRLLWLTFWPSLFSSFPAVLVTLWISTYHSYSRPSDGVPVAVTFVPETTQVVVEPSQVITDIGNGQRVIAVTAGKSIWFGIGGRTVYEGIFTDPPVKSVQKKRWWNVLMADEAGYIRSEAPVDQIVFDLPRKRFIESGPVWLTTWELPFSFSLFISAITTKCVFKIE